jgi:hypothetical protein
LLNFAEDKKLFSSCCCTLLLENKKCLQKIMTFYGFYNVIGFGVAAFFLT